jgi:hypothetical protein
MILGSPGASRRMLARIDNKGVTIPLPSVDRLAAVTVRVAVLVPAYKPGQLSKIHIYAFP